MIKKIKAFAVLAICSGVILFIAGCKNDTDTKYIEISPYRSTFTSMENYSKAKLVTVTSENVTVNKTSGSQVFKDNGVKISPYAIGRYEVTQELFKAVMGYNPSYYTGTLENTNAAGSEEQKLRPAEYVSFYDAITFCNKLSLLCGMKESDLVYSVKTDGKEVDWANIDYLGVPKFCNGSWDSCRQDLTKKGYRLPTPAEWEFAARGGNQKKDVWNYKYSGSETISQVAWYGSTAGTHETGLKEANGLGIYDMSGNVWEWCFSTESDGKRYNCGGSFGSSASDCTVASRHADKANYCHSRVGFRLARTF